MSVSIGFTPPRTFVNVLPPSVLTCHWTRTSDVPVNATLNVAFAPAAIDAGAGGAVTTGASPTVRTTAAVRRVLLFSVNAARKYLPVSDVAAANVKLADVAPTTGV